MGEQLFLLGSGKDLRDESRSLRATVVGTPAALIRESRTAPNSSVWVASRPEFLRWFTACPTWRERDRRLLLLEGETAVRRALARAYFRVVVSLEDGFCLAREELLAVLSAENREDLLIGGHLDEADEVLVLYRGDLACVVAPLGWFKDPRLGTTPDLSHIKVIDFGQTLQFGSYEVATHAILYEFDKEYRRRAKARRVEEDASFGGSLRRLRTSRGLSRRDFEPEISAKEVARLENGDVAKPHEKTLKLLAKRLGVKFQDLSRY